MRVLQPEARRLYRQAGAEVDEAELRVRFDRAMVMERIATAPAAFELSARNPERNVKVGGRHCIFSSVGGPAYVMDNDRGRRPGTYAEMCDYLKLIQSLNVLHQEGGGPFEPLDLPAEHAPPRPLLRRDHAARQELAAADARHGARHRRAGDGGDLARHDAREAGGRDACLHRRHQHQLAAAARRADGRRADRHGRARPGQHHHAVHPGRRHVAR